MTAAASRVSVVEAARKHLMVVVGTTFACLAVGLVFGLVRAPSYTATTQLYVQVQATEAADVANIAEASAALAPAYSRLVHAGAVVGPVARQLRMTPTDVVSHTSASPIPVSPVVRIRADARSAERAISLANLTAESLAQHVRAMNEASGTAEALLQRFEQATRAYGAARDVQLRLEKLYATTPTAAIRAALDASRAAAETAQLKLETARARYATAEAAPILGLTSLGQAQSATSDKWSKLALLLFICLLAGLAIGVAVATLLEVRSARVHTSQEMMETLGLEMLAAVPLPQKGLAGEKSLVMLQNPDSLDAEAYRVLRMNLELLSLESGARTFVFVSALKGEGKTTTVCNLAAALALAGRRVVIVDGDVRQAAVARALGLEGLPGLADVVQWPHRLELSDVIARVGVAENGADRGGDGAMSVADVDVVPVGDLPSHPGEFAVDSRFGQVLEELSLSYEFVLIDTPPLLVVGDAMAIATRADAVIPVARLDYVSSRDLREFRRVIDALPCQPVGFVLTGAPTRAGRYRGYEPAHNGAREPVG
jgi:Mrp family chromosome partitioning ATPase/capsular polysaccharide biosynthesis protein